MAAASSITIRRARRDDVGIIVRMLADDPLGGPRERLEDPLPPSYLLAFERVDRDQNIQLVVAEDGDGAVIGCLQLCILPGISSQGAARGLIEDVRVATHCRSRGIGEQTGTMGHRRGAGERLQAGRAIDASYPRRCPAVLRAARIPAEPCRDDITILIQAQCSRFEAALRSLPNAVCHSFGLTGGKLLSPSSILFHREPCHTAYPQGWLGGCRGPHMKRLFDRQGRQ